MANRLEKQMEDALLVAEDKVRRQLLPPPQQSQQIADYLRGQVRTVHAIVTNDGIERVPGAAVIHVQDDTAIGLAWADPAHIYYRDATQIWRPYDNPYNRYRFPPQDNNQSKRIKALEDSLARALKERNDIQHQEGLALQRESRAKKKAKALTETVKTAKAVLHEALQHIKALETLGEDIVDMVGVQDDEDGDSKKG